MTHEDLVERLRQLGCPSAKLSDMARQLDKRASQLAQSKGRTYEDALTHLLELMGQGWAARPR